MPQQSSVYLTSICGLDSDVLVTDRPPVKVEGREVTGFIAGSPAGSVVLAASFPSEGRRDVLERRFCRQSPISETLLSTVVVILCG